MGRASEPVPAVGHGSLSRRRWIATTWRKAMDVETLTAALTVLLLALSFTALHQLAESQHYPPWAQTGWPVSVDLFALVAMVIAFSSTDRWLVGEAWTWAISAAVVTLVGNVLSGSSHAHDVEVGLGMHGWSALSMVGGWHLLFRHRKVRSSSASAAPAAAGASSSNAASANSSRQQQPVVPAAVDPSRGVLVLPAASQQDSSGSNQQQQPTASSTSPAALRQQQQRTAGSRDELLEQVERVLNAAAARGERLSDAALGDAIGRSRQYARELRIEVQEGPEGGA